MGMGESRPEGAAALGVWTVYVVRLSGFIAPRYPASLAHGRGSTYLILEVQHLLFRFLCRVAPALWWPCAVEISVEMLRKIISKGEGKRLKLNHNGRLFIVQITTKSGAGSWAIGVPIIKDRDSPTS